MGAELLILGCGGLAKEAAQLARRIDPDGHRWEGISYVAESSAMLGTELPYGRVMYTDADLDQRTQPADVVIGTGHPGVRRKLAQRFCRQAQLHFPNLIHPQIDLDSRWVRLGRGNMLTIGTVLTCDIELGDFNLLNWNCTIGHDARIGSFNVINPSASISGGVRIGDACLIGTGARIVEQLEICSDSTIGAGAVVTRSVSVPGIYIGIPARLKSA
ncbi:acetyltransferase [Paucibacter sp. APW11]|uniref:Acetyltransferase n=1 Tax=Roseateles aquae TaxID=3077235 RepID=A0ABU3PF86_9BURK|nr:acetyltransferase [Paucibacter sp. APW11]MDT9001262.1 acetyltransferase [Paucibacter sp. APW11]